MVINMSKLKKITNIEKQKNNNKRFNIYLDNEYAFSVHEDVIVSYRLLVNKEVDEEELMKIIIAEEENKIWQKALRYLSYKSRTEAEVKKYLQKNSYELALIEIILTKLKEHNMLNDDAYAKQFVSQRVNFNPKGKKLLAFEMKSKGIDSLTIQNALEAYDQDQEYQIAKELVEKKLKQLVKEDWQQTKAKIGIFLQRKGFSYEVIMKVINDIREQFN